MTKVDGLDGTVDSGCWPAWYWIDGNVLLVFQGNGEIIVKQEEMSAEELAFLVGSWNYREDEASSRNSEDEQ